MKAYFSRKTLILEIVLALVLVVSSFAVTQAIRDARVRDEDTNLLSQYESTKLQLEALEERFDALTVANQDLIAKRDELLTLVDVPDLNPELLSAWQDAALLAGMTALEGKGLVLVLEDKENYNPLVDHVLGLVHDKTMLDILTLLINNGASALSVNGIRLTPVTQIYCIGPTILCNAHRLAPPYEIKVMGAIEPMKKALADDLWLQRLTSPQIGVRLSITERPDVRIPSYADRGDYLSQITLLEES